MQCPGSQALKALEKTSCDLVLMDCQMPVMDGYKATRQIRAGSMKPGMPIIAMTAHAMPGDREKCLEAGINDYIAKPFNPLSLANMLEKWLQE